MNLIFFVVLSYTLTLVLGQPCQNLSSQTEIDECYMKIALDFAFVHNPQFPFGALIVDHTKNTITCYGVNSVAKNVLLHGNVSK